MALAEWPTQYRIEPDRFDREQKCNWSTQRAGMTLLAGWMLFVLMLFIPIGLALGWGE
jgi:hypothetical protein